MKNFTLLSVLFILSLLTPALQAQTQTEQPAETVRTSSERYGEGDYPPSIFSQRAQSVVSFHPFPMARSFFQMGYQHSLSSTFALALNAAVGFAEASTYYELDGSNQNYVNAQARKPDMSGASFDLQGRYYFGPQVQNGGYVGLFARYKMLQLKTAETVYYQGNQTVTNSPLSYKLNAISGGVLVGYQLLIYRITLDFYMGGGPMYANGDYKKTGDFPTDKYMRGMAFYSGFSIGLRLK